MALFLTVYDKNNINEDEESYLSFG